MRCLLAADLHYSLQQFDWVNEVAGYFDIVVLAGDHLDLGSIVDYRAQSAVVKQYIGKLKEKDSTARLLRESRPRFKRPNRGEGIAMDPERSKLWRSL